MEGSHARSGWPRRRGSDGDACTVVLLRGEHDVSTVAALSEAIARATALDDADLVVDLSGVAFMDAATIGVFVRASEALRPRSRSLTLRSPSTRARRVLDVCGVDDRLDCHPVDPAGMTGPFGRSSTTA